MRCFLWLSMLGLAGAESEMARKGDCVVNSGEAVSDAMDAAMFIWASNKRCGKVGLEVKCEVDVSSAIKSLNSMINVILKVVDQCGKLHTHNKHCGMQASQLTEHIAALSSASGMVYQKCTGVGSPYNQAAANAAAVANNNHIFNGQNQGNGMGAVAAPVMCTMDLKNTLRHLFKAIHAFQRTKDACHHQPSDKCSVNVLDIMSGLSGMGAWLAGSVGQCKRAAAKLWVPDTRKALCAQASSHLLEYTMKISQDGLKLKHACHHSRRRRKAHAVVEAVEIDTPELVPRLYEEDGKKDAAAPVMNLVLGAFLPITAIVSFVGGRFYANRRSQIDQARDFGSDHE